jgi:predicted MFS family arabinose efflux permease
MLRRNRRFQLLLVGQSTSRLGDGIEPVALAALVVIEHNSPVLLGVVIGLRSLATVLTAPLGGVIADRMPRTHAMMSADATQAVAMVAIFIHPSSAVLLIAAPASGVAVGVASAASNALVPQVVPADQLQRANSVATALGQGATVAGPLLGGLIVAAISVRAAFLINALTFGVSFACLALIRVEDQLGMPTGALRRDFRDGLGEILRRPWVIAVIGASAVQAPTTLAVGRVAVPLLAIDHYGTAAYGGLISAQAAGFVVGALLAGSWSPRLPGLFGLLGSLVYPLFLIALGAKAPIVFLYFVSVLAGAGLMFFGMVWITALQRHIPPARLGRVIGLNTLGNFGLEPPGAAAAGALAQAIGAERLLYGAGAIGLVATAAPLLVPGVAALGGAAEPSQTAAPDAMVE